MKYGIPMAEVIKMGQAMKALMRNAARLSARALPREDRERFGEAITNRIAALPEYARAHTIFCYVSMPDEPDTRGLMRRAFEHNKAVCVPRCVRPGVMEARRVSCLEELRPGAYGILEPPPTAEIVPFDRIEFSVLPCACCTRAGDRLGRGGGYYDRFLAEFAGVSIAACFERLIVDAVPMEAHDVRVQMVATELGVWARGDRIHGG